MYESTTFSSCLGLDIRHSIIRDCFPHEIKANPSWKLCERIQRILHLTRWDLQVLQSEIADCCWSASIRHPQGTPLEMSALRSSHQHHISGPWTSSAPTVLLGREPVCLPMCPKRDDCKCIPFDFLKETHSDTVKQVTNETSSRQDQPGR